MTNPDNMKLWRAFELTDPAHTKPVEFGRKFTSIDAHWQIMRVTEQLGPIGQGWGYRTVHSVERLNDHLSICFCDVTIWWVDDSAKREYSYGPVRGCAEFFYQQTKSNKLLFNEDGTPKMQLDDDAPKKAMTDALTKGLSHLGVSADVFLGLFDDNKYVEKMKRRFTVEKAASGPLPKEVSDALGKLFKTADLAELHALADATRPLAAKWDKLHQELFALRLSERRLQFESQVAAAE